VAEDGFVCLYIVEDELWRDMARDGNVDESVVLRAHARLCHRLLRRLNVNKTRRSITPSDPFIVVRPRRPPARPGSFRLTYVPDRHPTGPRLPVKILLYRLYSTPNLSE